MARCGCSGTSCSCVIEGAGGVTVTGSGSVSNPYIVTGGGALTVVDGASVDLSLTGDGTLSSPYVLTAETTVGLEDLTDLDETGKAAGKVVAVNGAGTGYELQPPSTATPGAIVTTGALDGDGSGGDPLAILLDGGADSGLSQTGLGLKVIGSGPGSSYTPAWTGSSTDPAIGDGTLSGRYIHLMNLCFLSIDIIIGASTSRGSGVWSLGLPPGLDGFLGQRQVLQFAITTPTGGGSDGFAVIDGGSTLTMYLGGTSASRVAHNNPSSLPVGSHVTISGMYEVA